MVLPRTSAHAMCASLTAASVPIGHSLRCTYGQISFLVFKLCLKLVTKFTILNHLNTVQCVRECKVKTPKLCQWLAQMSFLNSCLIFTCGQLSPRCFTDISNSAYPNLDITIIFWKIYTSFYIPYVMDGTHSSKKSRCLSWHFLYSLVLNNYLLPILLNL